MAITRAQQAKQMLQDGGRTGFFTGMRAQERKEAADRREQASVARTQDKKVPDMREIQQENKRTEDLNRRIRESSDLGEITRLRNKNRFVSEDFDLLPGDTPDPGVDIKLNKREQLLRKFIDRRPEAKFSFGIFDALSGGKLGQAGMDFLASKNRPFFGKVIEGGRFQLPGELGEKYGKLDMFDLNTMTEDELEQAYKAYGRARLGGEIRAIGDKKPGFGKDQGDYSDSVLPIEGIFAAKPKDEEVIEETFTPNFRLMADGGRAKFNMGGKQFTSDDNISPGTDVKGNIRKDNPFAGREPEGPTVNLNKTTPDLKADPRFDFGRNIGKGLPPKELARLFNEFYKLSTDDEDEDKYDYFNVSDTRTDPTGMISTIFQPQIASDIKKYKAGSLNQIDNELLRDLNMKAEGGMPYEGGIMDLESGRQMYFLGKLVKKATRAVKKIVKSPIGKAALLAAPFVMGGGLTGLKGKLLGVAGAAGTPGFGGKEGLLKSLGLIKDGYGKFGGLTGKGMFGLGSLFTLAPFLMDEEDTTNQSQMYKGADLPYPVDYYLSGQYGMNRRLVADGGMMRANYQEGGDAEPVAKKTMPLIDMDGQEKDYRETGGFVDMGRMERADDVPARLSKNEFVFTADAVRNAGEGDIDKGAEVMYNMMKNLEAGGEVSEESQGLEGAREMFQTSQRLEEVL